MYLSQKHHHYFIGFVLSGNGTYVRWNSNGDMLVSGSNDDVKEVDFKTGKIIFTRQNEYTSINLITFWVPHDCEFAI